MEVDEPPAVLVLDEFQQYQRKNPTRNQDVPYEELQRKLRELELEPHLTALAKANASLVNFLWPFTVSKKYNEDAEQSDAQIPTLDDCDVWFMLKQEVCSDESIIKLGGRVDYFDELPQRQQEILAILGSGPFQTIPYWKYDDRITDLDE